MSEMDDLREIRIASLRASLTTAEKERDEAQNEACVRCGFPTHDITSAAELRLRAALEKALGALRAAADALRQARPWMRTGHVRVGSPEAAARLGESYGGALCAVDDALTLLDAFSGGAHVDAPKAP